MTEPNDQYRAVARVQVTVEVSLTQPWTGTATLDDVGRQASKEALEKVRNAFDCLPGVRAVGEPHVEAIITAKGDG